MIEKRETKVPREKVLPRQDLARHLRAIGQAIINDADSISGISHGSYIGLVARIVPMQEVTMVHYTIERISEPGFVEKEKQDV